MNTLGDCLFFVQRLFSNVTQLIKCSDDGLRVPSKTGEIIKSNFSASTSPEPGFEIQTMLFPGHFKDDLVVLAVT